jgi:membrane protease YdiL (CAAX protease family)
MDETPEVVNFAERPSPAQPASSSLVHKIFFNDVELRAGWRFLIFFILLIAVTLAVYFVISHVLKSPPTMSQLVDLRPGAEIVGDGLQFAMVLGVAAIMAKFENRKLRYYGLPLKSPFLRNFWLGCLWGFFAISGLLMALRFDHNFYFGSPELSGSSIVRMAIFWAIAFVAVGIFEEFLLRGYAQFTLTTGMGFWPAAFLLSFLFAGLHLGNPGETKVGLFQIVLIGLFFCFTLWRTGTLWFAVGFHASWDWGQSFFYGTPDSGLLAQGRLMHSSFAGPEWLTGGSAGPEGSVLVAPVILLLFVLFYFAFPTRVPYPDPEAIKPAAPTLAPKATLGI